jgi:hypothetical protein
LSTPVLAGLTSIIPHSTARLSTRLGYKCRRLVRLEAKKPDRFAPQDPARLVGNRAEDLSRGRFARDKCRHAPKRSLLLDEQRKRIARLGLLDRRPTRTLV